MDGVARGDHPMRTPVYGAALIVAAMLGSVAVWQSGWPGWLKGALLLVALGMALAGWLMLKDPVILTPRKLGASLWTGPTVSLGG